MIYNYIHHTSSVLVVYFTLFSLKGSWRPMKIQIDQGSKERTKYEACLVPKKFYKKFQILCHIESCDTCMKALNINKNNN